MTHVSVSCSFFPVYINTIDIIHTSYRPIQSLIELGETPTASPLSLTSRHCFQPTHPLFCRIPSQQGRLDSNTSSFYVLGNRFKHAEA